MFEPLKKSSYFRRFFVEGGTVVWPNGADIDPETLTRRHKAWVKGAAPSAPRQARGTSQRLRAAPRVSANALCGCSRFDKLRGACGDVTVFRRGDERSADGVACLPRAGPGVCADRTAQEDSRKRCGVAPHRARSRQPTILLHGGLGDYRAWQPQMQTLSPRYRVISYSRRYHYPNENPLTAGDHSALNDAADLAGLIASSNWVRCTSWALVRGVHRPGPGR